MDATTAPRQRYLKRNEALKSKRLSWLNHWQELSDYIKPRRGNFNSTPSDVSSTAGQKKNQHIINNTPTTSSRVLAAGMMAGITSPARPWFRLTTPDPDLAESAGVREWLHRVEERLRLIFARSNVYKSLHETYADLGDFGTAALHIDEDAEDLIRSYVLPIGQYALANDERLRVSTVYRETTFTVEQLVRRFGKDACSVTVQTAFAAGDLDRVIPVLNVIEPRSNYEPGKIGPPGMKWKSCWLEIASDDPSRLLAENGYEEFPVMAPRWDVNGENVYGDSPGMVALGDCRALQLYEKRKAELVDKLSRPPMQAPSSLQNQRVSLLPGDVTYVPDVATGQVFRPAMDVNPAGLQAIELSVQQLERRVQQAYYADLWLALLNSEGQMTAREVAERHEEKMLQLGPVMERLQDELLDPLIDRVYGIALRNGQIPPAPQELQGVNLRVEYISIMAQAQKLLGTSAVERLLGLVGNVAAVHEEITDKIDFDKVVTEYGDMLGVKPDLIRTDEQVSAMRKAREQAAQQQAAMQQASVAAQNAKVLADTDMGGDNALNRLVNNLGGTAAAAAGSGLAN